MIGLNEMTKIKIPKAFTLTELLIVVTLIGIIAAFAIPNYSKTIDRAHVRDAVTQLTSIWSANKIYKVQNGQYWPPDTNSHLIAEINLTLGLGIIENGMTYSCVQGANPGTTFTCTATRGAITVTVTEAAINAPPITTVSNPGCSPAANC